MISLNPIIFKNGIQDRKDITINWEFPLGCSEENVRIYHNKLANEIPEIHFSVYYPEIDLEFPIYHRDNINMTYLLPGNTSFNIVARSTGREMDLKRTIEYCFSFVIDYTCDSNSDAAFFEMPVIIEVDLDVDVEIVQRVSFSDTNDGIIMATPYGGVAPYTVIFERYTGISSDEAIEVARYETVQYNSSVIAENLSEGNYIIRVIDVEGKEAFETLTLTSQPDIDFTITAIVKNFTCNYFQNYHISEIGDEDGIVRFNLFEDIDSTYQINWTGPYTSKPDLIEDNMSTPTLYDNVIRRTSEVNGVTYNRGDLVNVGAGWYRCSIVTRNRSSVRVIELKEPPKTIVSVVDYYPPLNPNANNGRLDIEINSVYDDNRPYELIWRKDGEPFEMPEPYHNRFDFDAKITSIKYDGLPSGSLTLQVVDCRDNIIQNIEIKLDTERSVDAYISNVNNSCGCEAGSLSGEIELVIEKAVSPFKVILAGEYNMEEEFYFSSITDFPYKFTMSGLDADIWRIKVIDSLDDMNLSQSMDISNILIKKPVEINYVPSSIIASFEGSNNGGVELEYSPSDKKCHNVLDSFNLNYDVKFEWDGPSIKSYNKTSKNQSNLLPGSYAVTISPYSSNICIDPQIIEIDIPVVDLFTVHVDKSNPSGFANYNGEIELTIVNEQNITLGDIRWYFENEKGKSYTIDMTQFKNQVCATGLPAGIYTIIIDNEYLPYKLEVYLEESNPLSVSLVSDQCDLNIDYYCETGKIIMEVDSYNHGMVHWTWKGYDLFPVKDTDFKQIDEDGRRYQQLIRQSDLDKTTFPFLIIEGLRAGTWEYVVSDASGQEISGKVEITWKEDPCTLPENNKFEVISVDMAPNPVQYEEYKGDITLEIDRCNHQVYCEDFSCCGDQDIVIRIASPNELGVVFDYTRFGDVKYLISDCRYLYPYPEKNPRDTYVLIKGNVIKDRVPFIIPIISKDCVILRENEFEDRVRLVAESCFFNNEPLSVTPIDIYFNVNGTNCCRENFGENRKFQTEFTGITTISGEKVKFDYSEDYHGYLHFNFDYVIDSDCDCCENKGKVTITNYDDCALDKSGSSLCFGSLQNMEIITDEFEIEDGEIKVEFKYTASEVPTDRLINFYTLFDIQCEGATSSTCDYFLCPNEISSSYVVLALDAGEEAEYENTIIKQGSYNSLTPVEYPEGQGYIAFEFDFGAIPTSIQVQNLDNSITNISTYDENGYTFIRHDDDPLYSDSTLLSSLSGNSKLIKETNGFNIYYLFYDRTTNTNIVPYVKKWDWLTKQYAKYGVNDIKSSTGISMSELIDAVDLPNGPLTIHNIVIEQNTTTEPPFNGSISFDIEGGVPPYKAKLVKANNAEYYDAKSGELKDISFIGDYTDFTQDVAGAVLDGDSNALYQDGITASSNEFTNIRGFRGDAKVSETFYFENDPNSEYYTLIVWDSSNLITNTGEIIGQNYNGNLYQVVPNIYIKDISPVISVNSYKRGLDESENVACVVYDMANKNSGNIVRISIDNIPDDASGITMTIRDKDLLSTVDINGEPYDPCLNSNIVISGTDRADFLANLKSSSINTIVSKNDIEWEQNSDVNTYELNINFNGFNLCYDIDEYQVDFEYESNSISHIARARFMVCEPSYFDLNKVRRSSNDYIIDISNSSLFTFMLMGEELLLDVFTQINNADFTSKVDKVSKNKRYVTISNLQADSEYLVDIVRRSSVMPDDFEENFIIDPDPLYYKGLRIKFQTDEDMKIISFSKETLSNN